MEASHGVDHWYLEIGSRNGSGLRRQTAALAVRRKSHGPRHLYWGWAHDVRRMRRTTHVAARHQPEIQLLLRQLYFDGERLVTRVDAASDASRIGSDQVRGVRFEGERMILMPPARQTGGSEEYREISWERIAPE